MLESDETFTDEGHVAWWAMGMAMDWDEVHAGE